MIFSAMADGIFAFALGLLFTLRSLLFYVSLIGEKTGLWKPQNLYVRIGTVLFIWLLSCAESGWSVRYGYFPFFLAITVLLGFCQKHMKKLRLVCLALGSMIFLSSCGAVEPEKRLYPLAVAFDYVSEEATAPENSETGEETGTAVSEQRRREGDGWRSEMARLVCACHLRILRWWRPARRKG
ncbi:MAG: hypothetical protein ACLSH1_10160 [Clostridia bacterium]